MSICTSEPGIIHAVHTGHVGVSPGLYRLEAFSMKRTRGSMHAFLSRSSSSYNKASSSVGKLSSESRASCTPFFNIMVCSQNGHRGQSIFLQDAKQCLASYTIALLISST